MRNNLYICVFDYETDDVDEKTTEPVQLAAVMLDPITLEFVDDSEFNVTMRPADVDDEGYFDQHKKCIEWHANNHKVTAQEILKRWKESPPQEQGHKHFVEYLLKYNKNKSRRTVWNAPIAAGTNIRNFDLPILQRMCTRFKTTDKNGDQKLFFPRDQVDIKDMTFLWFEGLNEPENYKMDKLRKFFGMKVDGVAHDALQDVRDEGAIIQRFMRLTRHFATKVKFKGSFAK